MPCLKFTDGVVCVNPTVTHTYEGREYRWEMHRYCGPSALNRDGSERKHAYGEKHPFWKAVEDYYKQQEETDNGGKAHGTGGV